MGREKGIPAGRPYGQGNIVDRGGGAFRLRVYMGRDVVTGRPIQKSREFRGTRAGAEKALQRFRAEIEAGPTQLQTNSTKVLLRDVIAAHLEASTLAPGTRRSYESALRKHIADGIGAERAEALTSAKFRAYYRALAADRGLSASSIWSIYSLISGSLRRAVREHGLRFDWNQMVTPPKPTADKQEYATDAELARAFAAADELGGEWPLVLRLACATGMRRGEIVALRWSSLDANGRLYVSRAITDEKGAPIEKLPKNGHPRYVQLDDETVRRWHDYRQVVADQCAASGLIFEDDRYVFSSNPEGTTPRRPDRVTVVWESIRAGCELNPGLQFRALRNWHVTVLDDELGFELAKIGRRVGHARESSSALGMTARYSLSDKKVDAEMAAGVAAKLAMIDDLKGTLR